MDQNGGIGISSPHSSPRNINVNNYLHRSQGVQVRDCSTWIKNRNKKGHIKEDRKQRFTTASPLLQDLAFWCIERHTQGVKGVK